MCFPVPDLKIEWMMDVLTELDLSAKFNFNKHIIPTPVEWLLVFNQVRSWTFAVHPLIFFFFKVIHNVLLMWVIYKKIILIWGKKAKKIRKFFPPDFEEMCAEVLKLTRLCLCLQKENVLFAGKNVALNQMCCFSSPPSQLPPPNSPAPLPRCWFGPVNRNEFILLH